MVQRSFVALALCLSSNALLGAAFAPAGSLVKKATISDTRVFSSEYEQPYSGDGSEGMQNPEEQQQAYQYEDGATQEQQYEIPQQIPQQPPAPRQRRLDPLLASMTRQDPSTANAEMTTVPIFGEIPKDSVKVLVPIAVVGIIGFLYSVIVTLSSGDELARALMQVSDDIAEKVAAQPNQVYDPDVCRGICTQDQSGLKTFMESLRK